MQVKASIIRRSNVLRRFFIGLLFFVVLFNSTFALATQGFANNIVIRQQTKTANGISVCAPVEIDLKILDIVRRADMKSIDDYAKWLQKTVQYKKDDNADVWSQPEETLARESGDCEDIAFLNETFLQVMGYKPKVMALLRRTSLKGHAICVFEENGRYLWFDNTTLKKTTATSMDEFAKYILKQTAYFSLAKIDFETNKQIALADKK